MRSNKRNVIFYLSSFVLISVVFAGSLELSTRMISFFSGSGFSLNLSEIDATDQRITDLYTFHPFTGFVFRPNLTLYGGAPGRREKSVIYTDNNGFLGNQTPVSYQKESNEIRIAMVGASTTASINLSYEDNWPGQIQKMLRKKFPGRKITIINAAVPGYDTAQSIGNLSLRVMPFKPDIVIIYHAYNDLKVIGPGQQFKPDYSHIHNTAYGFHPAPPIYKAWLEKSMLYVRTRNKFREANKDLALLEGLDQSGRMSEIPEIARQTFEDHIRSLIAIAGSGGAKVVLSSFATLHDPQLNYGSREVYKALSQIEQMELVNIVSFTPGLSCEGVFKGINLYNRTLADIAKDTGVGWVDNAKLIPHDERYFVDRVHFSSEGASLMAQNLLPVLEKILRDG